MVVSASLATSNVAVAQVGPTESSFEIDGDHGSLLDDIIDETSTLYLPGDEVIDGGANTFGRRQHESCHNWTHGSFEPYMGHDSYRVRCDQEPPCTADPDDCTGPCLVCPQRRSEQMVLSNWLAGDPDTTRYF
jgi:hypothetical protein